MKKTLCFFLTAVMLLSLVFSRANLPENTSFTMYKLGCQVLNTVNGYLDGKTPIETAVEQVTEYNEKMVQYMQRKYDLADEDVIGFIICNYSSDENDMSIYMEAVCLNAYLLQAVNDPDHLYRSIANTNNYLAKYLSK